MVRGRDEWGGRRASQLTAIVLERDQHRCIWCGGLATTAEHIVPKSLGGPVWDLENLAAACLPCNSSRNNRPRPSRTPPRPSRAWGRP